MKRYFVIVILLVLLAWAVRQENSAEDNNRVTSPLLEIFTERYPEKEVILSSEGDCNNDKVSDLVVVYRENEDKNLQVTIYSNGSGYLIANPTPAPYNDCRIEWRDVDERPPYELIVSGRRGAKFGLGVFRFVENQWMNVYGSGMKDCC